MFRVECIDDRIKRGKGQIKRNGKQTLLRIGQVYDATQSIHRKDCYTIDLGIKVERQGQKSKRDFEKNRFIVLKEKKKYINKLEAHAAMLEGHKITHTLFDDEEYLYYDRGAKLIRDEKGYNFEHGWEDRSGTPWDEGWFIWEEAKQAQSESS